MVILLSLVMASSSFRVNAKNFFLTFPKCNTEKETLLEHLLTLNPIYIKVAREKHQDGTNHLHAVLSFASKKNIKNKYYFDYNGHHCNIQAVKSWKHALEYLNKEDPDPLQHGDEPMVKRTWKDCLGASSADSFLELAAEVSPRDYIINHERLLNYVERKYKRTRTNYEPDFRDFTIPDSLQNWIDTEFNNVNRPKTLVLVSPTRFGKTEWARSLNSHMYFNAYFNLDDWDSDAKYIILDDIPWERTPAKKAFFGAQKEFVLTDKYKRKITVKWGKPLIFLCNTIPFYGDTEADWFIDNSKIIELKNKLYLENYPIFDNTNWT